jgi:hippurate hydrolase
VLALQALVSRNTDPIESAVVSVTAFLSGEAFNVIPDTAELRGTIRTLKAEVRDTLEQRLKDVAIGVGEALGASVDVDYRRGYPSIVNDPRMEAIVREAAIESVGPGEHDRPTSDDGWRGLLVLHARAAWLLLQCRHSQ